jgi:hypothetical protein
VSYLEGEDTISMPPLAVDLFSMAEHVLPQLNIHLTPASVEELGDKLGVTDASDPTSTEILIREDLWDHLIMGGPRANLARATLAHEFGHLVLHAPVIRRRRVSPHARHLLARVARSQVPAYMDAEWQAWALAGCILAPRRTIMMVDSPCVTTLASIYEISNDMMKNHLRRLRLSFPWF